MGKKTKVGKSRKDDYYYLAKEAGYRARSSFKLIEINKKFHFLENASILIDLCAAPGGWMQVAAQTMRSSSLILGIDLVKIDPIPGTISLQCDITTSQCRKEIEKHLQSAKADVVLHDGAPNVGANWNVDEFQQAHLCLKAFALATEFLAKKGTFVSKVFRSKDYESLNWVFRQLFENVYAMKPKSSRNVSAEIYLVCEKYKAPTDLDPKFFDIAYVFQDVEETEKELTFEKVMKQQKKALGYEGSLYVEVKVSELMNVKYPMNILLTSNKVIIDDEDILNHPATTEEIKQLLQDLKLLNKHAFKKLKIWLKKVTPFYKEKNDLIPKTDEKLIEEKTEDELLDKEIEKAEQELKKEQKKKLKKERKGKMKKIKMIQQGMLHPTDNIEHRDNDELFSGKKYSKDIASGLIPIDLPLHKLDEMLYKDYHKMKAMKGNKIKSVEDYKKTLDDRGDNEVLVNDDDENNDDESYLDDCDEDTDMDSGRENDDQDLDCDVNGVDLDGEEEIENEDEEAENMNEDIVDHESVDNIQEEEINTIKSRKRKYEPVTDLDYDPLAPTPELKKSKRVQKWMSNEEFLKLMDSDTEEEDDDDEIVKDAEVLEVLSAESNPKQKKIKENCEENKTDLKKIANTLNTKLSANERALAVKMLQSKKMRREIIDWGYNKYQFDEEDNLPKWFVEGEKKHLKPKLPFITDRDVQEQREAMSSNINKRTIKKVEQAKARKKAHLNRKLNKINKKANNFDEQETDGQKNRQLKELNKKYKSLKNKKKPVVLEVTNKGGARNRVGKAKKGAKLKVVDKRMKSDKRVRNLNKKK